MDITHSQAYEQALLKERNNFFGRITLYFMTWLLLTFTDVHRLRNLAEGPEYQEK